MNATTRFALPLLAAGQAGKEITHNEAIQIIDWLLCPIVGGPPMPNPPSDPEHGQCFVIGSAATGAWTGRDGQLACFGDGGWRFISPVEGISVTEASGDILRFRGGSWERGILRAREVHIDGQKVIGERQPAISPPSGGATVDVQARAAIASILDSLRAHGLIAM
jgi:hypothetical protein